MKTPYIVLWRILLTNNNVSSLFFTILLHFITIYLKCYIVFYLGKRQYTSNRFVWKKFSNYYNEPNSPNYYWRIIVLLIVCCWLYDKIKHFYVLQLHNGLPRYILSGGILANLWKSPYRNNSLRSIVSIMVHFRSRTAPRTSIIA